MKSGIESLGRVRLQGLALLAAALISGMFLGMAGERLAAARRSRELISPPQMAPGLQLPPALEGLDLTPDQRRAITAIFERRHHATDSLFAALLPSLRLAVDSMQREVRELLTPEQREKFDRQLPPAGARPDFKSAPFAPPGPPPTFAPPLPGGVGPRGPEDGGRKPEGTLPPEMRMFALHGLRMETAGVRREAVC